MKTFLIVALIVVAAAVFINDVGTYARGRYDLSTATDQIVDQLSDVADDMTRTEAANRAAELARQRDVEVYQYDQDDQGLRIWTRALVRGTVVIGPYRAWRAGEELGTPFVVEDYATSVFR